MGKNEQNNNNNERLHQYAISILILGLVFILIAPIIFTLPSLGPLFDFSKTGNIGDTIGGLTAPIVGFIGAALLYLALKAQINANSLIQTQIEDQKLEKIQETETKQLYQFYNHLKENIDNFSYEYERFPFLSHIAEQEETSNKVKGNGTEAIYYFFHDIFCDPHDKTEVLDTNPKLTELTSILEICKLLTDKLIKSNSPEKETIIVLTDHQFRYRITPRLMEEGIDNLSRHYCEDCKIDHGLPDKFCELLNSINSYFTSNENSKLC